MTECHKKRQLLVDLHSHISRTSRKSTAYKTSSEAEGYRLHHIALCKITGPFQCELKSRIDHYCKIIAHAAKHAITPGETPKRVGIIITDLKIQSGFMAIDKCRLRVQRVSYALRETFVCVSSDGFSLAQFFQCIHIPLIKDFD